MGGKPRRIPAAVARTYRSAPAPVRSRLLELRELIFATAASVLEEEALVETLKWGEPSFLTTGGGGTTIRIGWKAATPQKYFLYVHCQTSLIATFREMFAEHLTLVGNRAIEFDVAQPLRRDIVACCIELALTYHRR